MLPRHTPFTATPRLTHARRSGKLKAWLQAGGSLTARLRAHGEVSVRVLRQGRMSLWPQERQALACSVGHVREVLLLVNGQAAVWARSSTPARAAKGPWRALHGLGTRPLAELLFDHRDVHRGPLQGQAIQASSPMGTHVGRSWHAALDQNAAKSPQWARRSVFVRRGSPLQVMEAFAPWVAHLAPGPR